MLEYFSSIGINAIFFQVRPAADAFFASPYEPWSEWLTGKQGQAPDPYYDPLEFYIEEAHKRNMEFHAWINPFRAVATIEFADIADKHITKLKPEWFFTYDINMYFNPGIPEVRDYIINIVADIVKRYDIDGIHFDDYFYPYPVRDASKRILPIPDESTYDHYNPDHLAPDEWRRQNLNLFIKGVNSRVKYIKPNLPFGVSPSGIWRNKSQDPEGSDTRGLSHYDDLYADVLTWLKEGYIDYVTPQLYWTIGYKIADYETLVRWWSEHTYGRHLYIGQAVYLAKPDAISPAWRNPNELVNQFKINRSYSGVLGSIFFKAKELTQNPFGFCDSLRYNYFEYSTGTPEFPWLPVPDSGLVVDNNVVLPNDQEEHIPNGSIYITKLGKQMMISWDSIPLHLIKEYRIYEFSKDEPVEINRSNMIENTNRNFLFIKRKRLNPFKKEYTYLITVIGQNGIELIFGNPLSVRL
jgi:uncharacterized lipoprotein YddW (UPF0748 family)